MDRKAFRLARVGDRLPARVIDRRRARRLDATAVVVPGSGDIADYCAALEARAADFADWDGDVVVTDSDPDRSCRVLVVDRYGQVYALHESAEPSGLPDADALLEWFRFLSTACPECGVLDDPVLTGPTP